MNINRRYIWIIAIPFVLFPLLWGGGYLFGLRFNGSSSSPIGLYYQSSEKPTHGQYVLINMVNDELAEEAANRGYFNRSSNGDLLLCKKVMAVEGDVIDINDNGVISINGVEVKNGITLESDSAGREISSVNSYPLVVGEGQYFVMGITPRSFDSRYFGTVNSDHIYSVVISLFTWGE